MIKIGLTIIDWVGSWPKNPVCVFWNKGNKGTTFDFDFTL